ncbi:Acetyltransferase [Gaiella occulta]|uniref:Acetyltransferase n=1 Tax=Gaiella occulta TaxID=1002870 RepID=A0A7M2Z0L5_9ACTN|nr:GNAT family N-acetyltransferase [Gaiella occulta]RDI75313.1 Acetyltransferase [Gaiella occulta]
MSDAAAVTIRPVRADEWQRWRDVRLRMLRDDADYFSTRYDDMVREPDAYWRDWAADAAAGVDKALFVAEEGGRWLGVVGAFARVDAREVQLVSMWVDPDGRGRGVARRLIRAVATWAAGRGSTRVVLFVQEANAPARRLYERAGFRPTGDRTPAGGGRSAFKLVLAASVHDLLA